MLPWLQRRWRTGQLRSKDGVYVVSYLRITMYDCVCMLYVLMYVAVSAYYTIITRHLRKLWVDPPCQDTIPSRPDSPLVLQSPCLSLGAHGIATCFTNRSIYDPRISPLFLSLIHTNINLYSPKIQ